MEPKISTAARLYSLKELSRRAGVDREFFKTWKIEFQKRDLVIQIGDDSQNQIRFAMTFDGQHDVHVRRKAWMGKTPPDIAHNVPDFVLPHCHATSVSGDPLFIRVNSNSFICNDDLLASVVLTLSRFEERQSRERDEHERFPASASVAFLNGFLDRPIVDEYGLAFQQVLRRLAPAWEPSTLPLRVKVSHDIDLLNIPFRLRTAVGHMLARRAPWACVRDVLSLWFPVEPTYLRLTRQMCQLSLDRNLSPAVYWKASPLGPYDTGYDLRDPRIKAVIAWCTEHGIEMGVHPGYETFRSRVSLEREVALCREAIGKDWIGGRQHFLRWSPDSWSDWENCGLAYDSSVGYADRVGFRAGTCVPYFPWLFHQDRIANVLEIPLIVMDGTLVDYMKLNRHQSLALVQRLLERCAAVGGVFTLLWHNSSLLGSYAPMYEPILDSLTRAANYDWESDISQLRHDWHRD